MKQTRFAFFSLFALAAVATSAFAVFDVGRTRVTDTVLRIAARFTAAYWAPVVELVKSWASDVLKVFLQPDWLAASLARLAHATRTAMKSWNDRHQSHYRAPGSWVACGST